MSTARLVVTHETGFLRVGHVGLVWVYDVGLESWAQGALVLVLLAVRGVVVSDFPLLSP